MEEWIPTLQRFVAAGLALLLVMLRLEAEHFSAAEYDETKDGRPPSFRRRIAWYGIGFVLITGILFIHPAAREEFFLGAGEDRVKTLVYGFLYGIVGAGCALGVALYRYHRVRLPDAWSYPGALINAVSTALIDEVTFRGAMFGLLLATGLNPNVANVIQALVYTLATRLGAPGRNRYMLVMALAVGLVGGWVTGITGGIAAAFLGHSITRFAVFVTTGHAGQFLPRGREEEEIDKKRRPPDGWRVIGPASREQASRDR